VVVIRGLRTVAEVVPVWTPDCVPDVATAVPAAALAALVAIWNVLTPSVLLVMAK
jgi:hypothetical protein